RLQLRRGDAEIAEEADYLVEVVELAPAGLDEDSADRDARQQRWEEAQAGGHFEQEPAEPDDGSHGSSVGEVDRTPKPQGEEATITPLRCRPPPGGFGRTCRRAARSARGPCPARP